MTGLVFGRLRQPAVGFALQSLPEPQRELTDAAIADLLSALTG
jgi:hypothetical protein